MNMNNFPFASFIKIPLLLLICTQCLAQKKYEREYSLKKSAIPAEALQFVTEVFKSQKVHWYGEESLSGTTIEAKLKKSGTSYSIEFSAEGNIQDVEMLTRFDRLPAAAQTAINKRLKDEFKNFKVVKTQTQWSGTRENLQKALTNDQLPPGITIHYEMVVKGQKTGLITYYEVLSSDKGIVTNVLEIIQRNSDNLIY